MATINKQFVTNRDNARIAGVQKYCMQQASILVAGVAYTPAQVIQFYQNELDALQTVAQAKTALKAALAKAGTVGSAADTFDSAFKRCIEGAYAGEPAALDAFGIVLATRTVPSAAKKAEAVVKGLATRSAHGNLGKQNSQAAAAASSVVAASGTSAPAPAGSGVTLAAKP